jgi:FAD/FMN-containing dehydrogenase
MSKRDAKWVFHPFATWERAADDAINIAWARDSNAAMRPHATGGVYLNFIGDEGQDRIRAAYGEENYRRLAEIKAQYDPDNVFRGNQNIMPAVPTG